MRLVLPDEIASGRGGPMELAASLERLLAGGERAAEELLKRAPASSHHHPQEQASSAEKAKVDSLGSVSYAAATTTKTKSFESTAGRHKHSKATIRQSDSKHMAPNSRQSRRQRQQQQVSSANIEEDASKLLLQQHLQNLSNHFRASQPHQSHRVPLSPSAPAAVSSFLESLQSGQRALAAASSSSTAASASHYQHQHQHQHQSPSPSIHGFMSVAALAAARQHQQQRQELLNQFASLHSLSAVASAIQQQQQQQSQHLGIAQQPQAASFMNGTASGASPVAPNHHFGGNSAAFNQVHQYNLAEQLARSLVHNHVPLSGLTQTPPSMDLERLASQRPSGFIAPPPLTRLPQSAPTTTFECLQADSQARPSPGQAGPQRRRTGKRRGARKCRKMYGMAQRQMWCTQCKWKKACSRFFGLNNPNHQSHLSHLSQSVVSSTSSVTTAAAEESRHGSSLPSTKAEAERR